MRIEILTSFVDRDSSTGKLTSYAQGDVVSNLSDEVANAFVSEGLAKVYMALGVSGNISITANGQYSVADYAGATVNVPDFKNLVDGSITEVTAAMLAGVTKIRPHAFNDCNLLTSVEIPSNIQDVGSYAFEWCESLTSATISAKETSDSCFENCQNLVNLTLGEGVEYLAASSFQYCTKIPSVEIPESVTFIGDDCFKGCSSLASVTVLATTPQTLKSGAFDNTSNNLVIYVPAESVDTYKAASGWSGYSSKIQAISE